MDQEEHGRMRSDRVGGTVSVRRIGASATKMRREALAVRAPVMRHQLVLAHEGGVMEETRTTTRGGIVAHRLPDEAIDDEAHAREQK